MPIGKKLKHVLIDKNIEQKELAIIAGVSTAYISRILRDEKAPSLKVLKKIADFLDISIDELLKE